MATTLEQWSLESSTLIKCHPTLVRCIQRSPKDIADGLIPHNLLSPQDQRYIASNLYDDADKARKIVDVVKKKARVNPQVYYTLVEVLKASGQWTKDTVEKLEETYKTTSPEYLALLECKESIKKAWDDLKRGELISPKRMYNEINSLIMQLQLTIEPTVPQTTTASEFFNSVAMCVKESRSFYSKFLDYLNSQGQSTEPCVRELESMKERILTSERRNYQNHQLLRQRIWKEKYQGLLQAEHELERAIEIAGTLQEYEQLLDEREKQCASWKSLLYEQRKIHKELEELSEPNTSPAIQECYKETSDNLTNIEFRHERCIRLKGEHHRKLEKKKEIDEKLKLLYKRQREWDKKYQELLEKERQWGRDDLQETMDSWKKEKYSFEQRKRQTFSFEVLSEEQKQRYKELVELSNITDDITQEEIQNMFEKMNQVSLYAEQSKKAEKYQDELKKHLKRMKQHERDIKEQVDYLTKERDEMNSTIQNLVSQKDDTLLHQLEACQRKSRDSTGKLEDSQRLLQTWSQLTSTCTQEIGITEQTLRELTTSLLEIVTDLEHLSRWVEQTSNTVEVKRRSFETKEGELRTYIKGLVGGGTVGGIGGAAAGAAFGAIAGPVGSAIFGFVGGVVGLYYGAAVGTVGAGLFLREREEELQKTIEQKQICTTGIENLNKSFTELSTLTEKYKKEAENVNELIREQSPIVT